MQRTLQSGNNIVIKKSSESGNLPVKSLNLLAILGSDKFPQQKFNEMSSKLDRTEYAHSFRIKANSALIFNPCSLTLSL